MRMSSIISYSVKNLRTYIVSEKNTCSWCHDINIFPNVHFLNLPYKSDIFKKKYVR